MVTDPKSEAALALHRFGFGPRVGLIAAIAGDPRGALLADIDRPGAGALNASSMHTSGEAARAAFKVREARRTARLAERAEREATEASTGSGREGLRLQTGSPWRRSAQRPPRQISRGPIRLPPRFSRIIATKPRSASKPRSMPKSVLQNG
jgi:hypothetical protein